MGTSNRKEHTMFRMPSPAMIVALIALFVATTGTAVAGALITART